MRLACAWIFAGIGFAFTWLSEWCYLFADMIGGSERDWKGDILDMTD